MQKKCVYLIDGKYCDLARGVAEKVYGYSGITENECNKEKCNVIETIQKMINK